MARGFESKSVADQQEQAQRRSAPRTVAAEADSVALRTRRKLELARVDVERRLAATSSEVHRAGLRQALDELERQLAVFPKAGSAP